MEGEAMKTKLLFKRTFFIFCIACVSMLLVHTAPAAGADDAFEKYRQAIKKEHGIDIRNFRDSMKGGRADGQAITKYNLGELLMGIKVEQEHTTNKLKALEIAMDHLEEFPDYYTRLLKMEEEAEKDMHAKQKK
jgi:hypothetical protein